MAICCRARLSRSLWNDLVRKQIKLGFTQIHLRMQFLGLPGITRNLAFFFGNNREPYEIIEKIRNATPLPFAKEIPQVTTRSTILWRIITSFLLFQDAFFDRRLKLPEEIRKELLLGLLENPWQVFSCGRKGNPMKGISCLFVQAF